MHLPFSDTQQPICFSCWGVFKHSFIHSLYKHIIQVENKNVGLKVGGGGGDTIVPPPNKKYIIFVVVVRFFNYNF